MFLFHPNATIFIYCIILLIWVIEDKNLLKYR